MMERINPDTAGRPVLIQGNSQVLFDGMIGLPENCMLNLKNKSHTVTAEMEIPDKGAEGVIVNEGGVTGGWVLYVKDNRLIYHYSFLGLQHTTVRADTTLTAGQHQARMEFKYDGGGLGMGGTVNLFVDGDQVGSGRIEKTHAYNYSLDETGGVGRDDGSPVCDDYPVRNNAFTGTINWVRLDIGDNDQSHLIDPAQIAHFAMSRQ
jgi:arylsulfatase